MLHQTGTVYWITGLPGAGKSSLAHLLQAFLRERGHMVVFLDGDKIRELLGRERVHAPSDRLELAQTYARLCHFLADQGLDVVCATVSLFHQVQDWNRSNIPHYREIVVEVPWEVLHLRDQKGLYSRAVSGENNQVPGLDFQAEWPENPDLVLLNDGSRTVEQVFHEMIENLRLL